MASRDTLGTRHVTIAGSRITELSLTDRGKGVYGFCASECDHSFDGIFTVKTYGLFLDPMAWAGIRIGTRSTPKGKAEAVRILNALTDLTLRRFPEEMAQIAPAVQIAYVKPNRNEKDWMLDPYGNLTLTPAEVAA